MFLVHARIDAVLLPATTNIASLIICLKPDVEHRVLYHSNTPLSSCQLHACSLKQRVVQAIRHRTCTSCSPAT